MSVFIGKSWLRTSGIFAGCIALGVHLLMSSPGGYQLHALYDRHVFRWVREVHDATLGKSAWPSLFTWLTLLFLGLAILIIKYLRQQNAPWKLTGKLLTQILSLAGWVIALFYFSWAFHYYRPPLARLLALPETKPDSCFLWEEFVDITRLLHAEKHRMTAMREEETLVLEDELRQAQVALLRSWSLPAYGRVRVRVLAPNGFLLRFSTAGIYLPWVNEGHIDGGLHQLQWPFTMAHEMAHGYGITDEGECNFIALLTCMRSSSPWIRYSALLAYWRYLYADMVRHHPDAIAGKERFLSDEIVQDLNDIRAKNQMYGAWFPDLRDWVYDRYLKAHGVSSGLQSYQQLPIQVMRWRTSAYAFSFRLSE